MCGCHITKMFPSGCKQGLSRGHLGSLWWMEKHNLVRCQKLGHGHGEGVKVAQLKSLPPTFWVQKIAPPEMDHGLEMASLFLTFFPIPVWPADSWKGSHTSFPLCRSPQLQLQLDLQPSELLWDLAAVRKVLAKKVMLHYYYHYQHAERCSCFPFAY